MTTIKYKGKATVEVFAVCKKCGVFFHDTILAREAGVYCPHISIVAMFDEYKIVKGKRYIIINPEYTS